MRTKVKKLTSVILAVVMTLGILTIAPLTVSAATYGDFEYTLEDDYTCTITKYNGSAANVTIPSTIYGNKVSAIGRYAFEENPNIKKVSMPNSVKIIDRGAFWYCGNLESVTMPTGLKEIGRCAFYETNLKSVVLPTGLKYISNEAFKFCYNLKTVTLPNTVESLGDACFGSCTSMQSISIPNSVKDMRWSTFDRCTSLKTVTIGSGVDIMNAYSVFGGCTSLESITVNSANKDFSSANGILYNKYKSEILLYPINKKDTAYTVPSSIDTLYEMSANGNTYLKTVTIPSNIKDIGDYAFGYIGEKYNYQKVSGFTIKGYKGTAAERYARNNDFNFVQLQIVPTSVALNKTTLTLDTGKTSNLKATVYPSNAANKKCTWSSSNTSVATVDGNGKVTAKKAGTATITVKTANGKTASCNVTVQAVQAVPTSVSLNKTSLTLDVSKSYTLAKTVSPSNAVTSYTWSSSNTRVATVDSNGKVTAKKAGTATITVKTSNGKTATCKVTVNLPAPQITGLANTTDGIKISWNKVDGAYGYRLYYKPVSGGWKRFKDTTATSFTDSGVVPNKTETYTIRCIDKNGNTISGFKSTGWSKKYTPVAPTVSKLDITTGGIKLSWNKIAGVYGYRLYYKTSSGGWKRFKDTTATSFTDSGVSPNRTETYTIRCIDKNGNTISGFKSTGWSKKYTPVAPTVSKLDITTGGIKLSWNKIAGVYGYRLYYKTSSGGWKRFKDTTATSFTDSGVSPNRTETYTIRCIDKNGNTVSGFYSKGWSKKYTPVAPTITRLSNTSKGVSVTWNKIAGVYGYRLYRKYDGGSWTRVKDTTSTSFTDSGAKKGKKVTYTVRCIDRKGKTVSGFNSKGWSITRK